MKMTVVITATNRIATPVSVFIICKYLLQGVGLGRERCSSAILYTTFTYFKVLILRLKYLIYVIF